MLVNAFTYVLLNRFADIRGAIKGIVEHVYAFDLWCFIRIMRIEFFQIA